MTSIPAGPAPEPSDRALDIIEQRMTHLCLTWNEGGSAYYAAPDALKQDVAGLVARAVAQAREEALSDLLTFAQQKTAQLPHDSDFTRGYTEGRRAICAEIRRRLASPRAEPTP